jgi:hypothetical protein
MDGWAAMTTSNVEDFDWLPRFTIATQATNIRPLPASMQSFYGNMEVQGVIHGLSVSECDPLVPNMGVLSAARAYSKLLSKIYKNHRTDLYITLGCCVGTSSRYMYIIIVITVKHN